MKTSHVAGDEAVVEEEDVVKLHPNMMKIIKAIMMVQTTGMNNRLAIVRMHQLQSFRRHRHLSSLKMTT